MFRRCVSLLVLVGFLASQLAMTPCAQGVTSTFDSRGERVRPHFHWGGWDGGQACPEHAACDHRHTHRPASEAADRGEVALESLCFNCFDHDADAIYLTAQWRVASPRSNLQDQASPPQDHDASAAPPVWRADPRASSAAYDWPPPDVVPSGSGLYLALGQLRI